MKIAYILSTLFLSLSIISPVFSKSLSVPFTVQAPDADWGQPWQDACEETTIAMVDYFYAGKTFTRENAKKSILEIIKIKEDYIGKSLDENAQTVADIINNFFPWEAKIVKNPSLEQIKTEIDNNRPVIALVHGKYLYNPYFTNGGPDYHSLVISGYDDTKKEFITQEPGTRRGLDFRYSYDKIINALHDFLPNLKTKFGDKLAIFTSPTLDESANLDGDQDGLTKKDEIKYKTNLWMADSDGDGHQDGSEVSMGYSPTSKSAVQTLHGTLIKSPESPMVYLFYNGTKRHILNEAAFINHGWQWFNIFTVPNSFVENLQLGETIAR